MTDTSQGGYSALTPTSITLVNSQNAARTLFYAVLGRLTT